MDEQRFTTKRILVGMNPRRPDPAPVDFGRLFQRLTGGELVIAAVEADWSAPAPPGEVSSPATVMEQLEAEMRELHVPFTLLRLGGDSAAKALQLEAERLGARLLVVGSSRRAVAGRVLLGSTAQRLFHGAPCPVSVVPSGWTPEASLASIAIAYVDTDEGNEALRSAYALARKVGARLRVVTVMEVTLTMPLETEAPIAGQMGKDLEDVEGEHVLETARVVRAKLAELGDDVEAGVDVFVGDPEADPADHLVLVSEHVDLMVCGSRGYGPVRAVLLGSVSLKLTAAARCPVIVLPRGVTAPLDALLAEPAGGRSARPV